MPDVPEGVPDDLPWDPSLLDHEYSALPVAYWGNFSIPNPPLRTAVPSKSVEICQAIATVQGDMAVRGHVQIVLEWHPQPRYVAQFSLDWWGDAPAWSSGTRITLDFRDARTLSGDEVALDSLTVSVLHSHIEETLIGPARLVGIGEVPSVRWRSSTADVPVALRLTVGNTFLALDDDRQLRIATEVWRGPRYTFRRVAATATVDGVSLVLESLGPWNELDRHAIRDARDDNAASEQSSPSPDLVWVNGQVPLGHVASLVIEVRSTGGFAEKDLEQWEEALGWFLVLASGSWNWPIRVDHLGPNGLAGSTAWRPPTLAAPRALASWFPRGGASGSAIASAVQRARELLADPDQAVWFQSAVTWYVNAVEAREGRSSVVLTQAALELLAWVHLVVERGMSPDGFGRMIAADKIRLLLQGSGADLTLAARVAPSAAAVSGQSMDPVTLFVETRNRAVHPPKRPSGGSSSTPISVEDAAALGLHLLEVCLLSRIAWTGARWDRIQRCDVDGPAPP